MKKIIYSLVIMIAAGSLFTSCVENTEPQGIRDLREAKADYLASLSKLREADAELVKAQAAYQSAQIAVVEADAALKQALANIAQALADAAQIGVEYLDAELQMKLEDDKAKAEQAAIKAQEDLAKAQFSYEQTLRNLAAKSVGLNEEEVKVLDAKVKNLETAQEDYHKAFVAVERKKMDIWDLEYDHDSINGKTIEDWEADIVDAETKIASAQVKIADLEEMKETPESIQEFVEVYTDSIMDLRKDSLLAVQTKELYEITVLKEASKAYGEKVEAFVKDSIPAAPKYVFAKIKGTDTLAKSYPLSGTGEDLDALFASYVNELIKNKSGKTAKDYKIEVKDKKTIEVGGKDVKKADLDAATEILGTIVEALSRHLVVVDDSLKAKKLDTLKKEAAKADTAYWKARKALEAGFEGWDVAKDSLAKLKAVKDAKEAAYDSVKTAHKNDTANLKTNAETLAAAYIEKHTKYADEVDRFKALAEAAAKVPSEYTMKATDTTALLDAVKAYGTAQKNYVGVEDSITVGSKKIVFSAMDSVRNDLFPAKSGDINGLQYDETAKLAFKNITDTVTWLKTNAKPAAVDFEKGVEAITKAVNDTLSAFNAYTAYNKAAEKDYIKNVYEPFYGVTVAATDTAAALKKVEFTWDDETFSFKEGCIVKFARSASGDSIIPTNTLKIVLDGVDGQGYSAETKFVNSSKIFKGSAGWTLFAKAINANQLAKEAENFAFLKDQLDNIKTQYAAIVSDLKAYNDQYAADSKAYKAGLKALTGKESESAIVSTLSETKVKNGKWDLKGKQLEFANEVAAEYPAIVKAASDGVNAIKGKIDDIQAFIDFLTESYVEFKNLEEGKSYQTIESIIAELDAKIDKYYEKIDVLKSDIQQYKKNIAKIEAGYDPYTVELQSEYDQLARLESELEIAEQKLKIAQAEYDAVIALYGINE